MSQQIDWEAFHEGLGLVNQAIGPWRALARLEEVLQYGTMLREQVLLAETQLIDTLREHDEKKKALAETDSALATVQANLTLARLQEEAETERLEKTWAEVNRKHQDLYDKEVDRARQALLTLQKEWEAKKLALQQEEDEKRAVIAELQQTLDFLKDRVKGLG